MLFKSNRLSAYTVYLLLSAINSFALYMIFTINMVYQVEIVKLNPLQLVLVGTMLEGACFLCQIPTGVIADVYSRRLSVVVGTILMGAGFLLEGLVPRFAIILLSQVLWGVGVTFTDGAQEAWIADEVGEEHAGRAFMRGTQIGQLASLLSVPVSIGLASIRLNVPIVVGGGVLLILGLLLLFFMPEHNFRSTPREERNSWQAMGKLMIDGGKAVRQSPMLISILCITAFGGMASEGFDRLQTAHFIQDFSFPTLGQLNPVVWFGIINVGSMLLALAATEIVRRYVDTNNQQAIVHTLFAFNVLLLVSVVVFGLVGNFFLTLAAYWSATILRRADRPIYMTWLTLNTPPRMRATVISLSGQIDAIGQIAGGPIIGFVGTLASLRAAIVASGMILTPNALFFARALSQSKEVPVDVKESEEQ